MDVIGFVKKHPLEIGGGVIAAFILYKLLTSGGGSSSGSNNGSLEASYFAAESAQAQAGDALQATQINAQATTAQTLIGANASVINNQTWAQAQEQSNDDNVNIAGINAKAAEVIAPYAVQSNLISTLGTVASQPGSTVTSSSSDDFLGLFGGSSTTSTYVPNPSAVSAGNILGELAGNVNGNSAAASTGLIASH